MRQHTLTVLLVFVLWILAGCGTKGPLYLPSGDPESPAVDEDSP